MIATLILVLSLTSASAVPAPPTPQPVSPEAALIGEILGQEPVATAFTCGQSSGAGCRIPCNDGSTVSCPSGYNGTCSFCTTFFVTCEPRSFLTCPDF